MTCNQFLKALNYANAVRLIVKEQLKDAGWQDFEITLSFEVDIDDSEQLYGYDIFIYSCDVSGISECISYPINKFLSPNFPLELVKLADSIKDYFIETFYVEKE